jgi:hypothetical protein
VNLHVLAKLPSFSINLDSVVQEFFEIRTVKDTVTSRFGVVDHKLMLGGCGFCGGGLGLRERGMSLLRRGLSKAVPILTILIVLDVGEENNLSVDYVNLELYSLSENAESNIPRFAAAGPMSLVPAILVKRHLWLLR